MDVLSEVLKAVKLGGAMFYNAEFSTPWCFCSPASSALVPHLSMNSKHVIIFYLLTEGLGYAQVEGDDRLLSLNEGDIHDQALMDWLRTSESVKLNTSVCTGSLLLGAAGCLKNKRVTTNQNAVEE